MKILSVFILLIFSLVSSGQQKQVCFSFDDLPVVTYGNTDSTYQKVLFNKIVSSLRTNQVPAIGFVIGNNLYENGDIKPYKVNLLRSWIKLGFELGNHTFRHIDYNNVSFKLYTDDITECETIVKKILDEQTKQLKYFRHTYLHVGKTKAKADSLGDFLINRDYIVAPVTIDNEDYLFALAYARAERKRDTSLMKRIGIDYVTYLGNKLHYYEKQSTILFGRNINQILLLHASKLNSDFLDSIIALFKENNYAFVSMDKALKDPVYQTHITVFGAWGISWIDRWALSEGRKGEFFREDPATPDYITKLAK